MKQKYHTPIIEEFAAESATLFAASGNNEDFGNKPGTYDLLDPHNLFGPSAF